MELWLADLHEINFLGCGGKYNTHNPYCYALASVWVKYMDYGHLPIKMDMCVC